MNTIYRADFRFAPSQWETALLYNDASHWLGASLESALHLAQFKKCTLSPVTFRRFRFQNTDRGDAYSARILRYASQYLHVLIDPVI